MSLSIECYISSPGSCWVKQFYVPTYFTFYVVHHYIHYSVIQDKKWGLKVGILLGALYFLWIGNFNLMLLAHLGYKFRPMMLGKIHFLVGKLWGRNRNLLLCFISSTQKHLGLSRLFISAGYFEIWHVKCPKKVDRMKGLYFAGFCDE